jgi:hypothetical protein
MEQHQLLFIGYGVPPVVVLKHVAAEMFTTGVSLHRQFGNINKKISPTPIDTWCFRSITGAYLLSDVIDDQPFIALYMIGLAVIIIRKAMQKYHQKKTKRLAY